MRGSATASSNPTLDQQLDRLLSTLTPREQTVIRLRFGIGYDEASTLEQVGQSLSVTRERIRQIEAKAVRKLQQPYRTRALAGFLDGIDLSVPEEEDEDEDRL